MLVYNFCIVINVFNLPDTQEKPSSVSVYPVTQAHENKGSKFMQVCAQLCVPKSHSFKSIR